MAEGAPILEFRDADLLPSEQPQTRVERVTMALGAGEAAVVRLDVPADFREEQFDYFPLADAAQGLLPCPAGQVFFQGRDWSVLQPLEQARARGRIGRLFEFHGWVYNLTVMENLALSCSTHRAKINPAPEALELAKRFGLEAVPEGRPVLLRKREQRLFEWVRAFLCQPELIILENPEMDMPRLALETCMELAQEARARGAAVLWITQENRLEARILETGASSYVVRGRRWAAGRE